MTEQENVDGRVEITLRHDPDTELLVIELDPTTNWLCLSKAEALDLVNAILSYYGNGPKDAERPLVRD